ncbi:MAG: DUF2490 domain-containing protein [Bacteroidales bacterium]|nr:DUF2490 domain-containing protein [Bacteroidales bacterium]MBN2761470.1 DUF2490 domain-containing protein [Bacteroidales bacterium]
MKTLKAIILFCPLMFQSAMAQEFRSSLALDYAIFSKMNAELEFKACQSFIPDKYSKKTIQGSLDYSLSKRWKLSASYAWSSVSKFTGNTEEIGEETLDRQRYTADLFYKPKRFDNELRLTNKFRYQYSVTENSKSKAYIRNKITLDYKFSKILEPYIALEPYYNIHAQRFSYLRLYIGNEMTVMKTKMEMYYIAEARLNEENFGVQYMLGIKLNIEYPVKGFIKHRFCANL